MEILDLDTLKWSRGPDLPADGGRAMSFSPAAASVNGQVVVNTSAGPLYRLSADGKTWEKVGKATRPRVVARLVPFGNSEVLLLGGASRGGMVAEVEVLHLAAQGEKVTLRK